MKHYLLKNSFLRGVLFLLLCAIGLGNAWGEEVTVTFDASIDISSEATKLTKDAITIKATVLNGTTGYYQTYKSQDITISCTNGNITKIVFTCTASGDKQYGPGCYKKKSGNYSTSDKVGTWTGNAASVTLTASSNQVRMTQIDVTYVVDTSITYSIIDRHDSGTNREYYVGDTPTADGLALIDNSRQEITEGVTWSFEPQTIQEETKSVTASAEYQGVKRAEYTYNITNKGIRTLSSIEIGGTPSKTSYYIGDTPSAEGLTVNAVYSDNSKVDVTDEVTWTFNPETIAEGTRQVTATASYRGEEVETTFDVTVAAAPIEYTYTLDLTTKTFSSATNSSVKWNTVVANITLSKGNSSTTANNYIGGSTNNNNQCTHTRIYKDQILTISPKAKLIKVVFTATSNDYANNVLYYENAIAIVDGVYINVFPEDGNCDIKITPGEATRFTQMVIHYQPTTVEISSAGLATFCLPYNATIPEGLIAYTATDNGESVKLHTKEGGKIAAGEGVVLEGDEGTYTFVAAEGSVKTTAGNQMVGVTKDTKLTGADNAYMLTRKKEDGSIAFRLLKTDYTLGANKAYLKASNTANIRELIPALWDDNATGIDNIAKDEVTATGAIYNLAGQKLMRAQKGINIINGKLVIK